MNSLNKCQRSRAAGMNYWHDLKKKTRKKQQKIFLVFFLFLILKSVKTLEYEYKYKYEYKHQLTAANHSIKINTNRF